MCSWRENLNECAKLAMTLEETEQWTEITGRSGRLFPWSECPLEVPVFRRLHGSPEFLSLFVYTQCT